MHLHPEPTITPQALADGQRCLVRDAAWASMTGSLSGGVMLVAMALQLGAGPLAIGVLGPTLPQRPGRLRALCRGICQFIEGFANAIQHGFDGSGLAVTCGLPDHAPSGPAAQGLPTGSLRLCAVAPRGQGHPCALDLPM